MSQPSKLLITGASGFLGWHLARLALESGPVIAIGNQTQPDLPAATCVQTDLVDPDARKQLLADHQPDAVIHCAAISKPNLCEEQPEQSHAINVDAALHLATLCAQRKIPFAFTSTDLVFDGQHGMYDEEATPNPVNLYGQQKWQAEQAILNANPAATVCRLPLMYGAPSPHAHSFLAFMLEAVNTNTACKLFSDEFRSVANVTCVARGLLLALRPDISGTLHLGGPERVSRYDIGLILARHMNVEADMFAPLTQDELQMAASRPPDVSLNSRKANALGYSPLSPEEGLKQVVESVNSIQ